jgi:two-component system cell cycle response regulator DivK
MTKNEGHRVLLVEDHPLNRELACDLLESAGLTVACSGSAEEALAMAALEPPDMILIDVTLPGMDGLEATRRLKTDPATWDICVVILTARAMKGDREAAIAAGCDLYLTKPLDTRTFAGEILALLHNQSDQRPSPPPAPPRTRDPA